jgi:hypothetical protein
MRGLVPVLFAGWLATAATPAWADRLSLPSETREIVLADAVGAALAEPLRTGAAAALPQAWTDRLVGQLGPTYPAACRDLTAHWGPAARGRGRFTARRLANEAGNHFIALRCGVDSPELAEYADERLVVLRDQPEPRRLFLIGHRPDCEHCTELTRLQPISPLSTEAGAAIGIRFSVSTENPCCGGPRERHETSRIYYLTGRDRPQVALALTERREEGDHTDPERDFISIYEARIEPQRDDRGRVAAVVADYTVIVNDIVQKRGQVEYRWSATEARFLARQR